MKAISTPSIASQSFSSSTVVTMFNSIIIAGLPREAESDCLFPVPDGSEPSGLVSDEQFGKFGSILDIKAKFIPHDSNLSPLISETVAVWVTYQSIAQAERALQYYCATYPCAPMLQKYCPSICKGRKCTRKTCMFLHSAYRPPLYLPESAKIMEPGTLYQSLLSPYASDDLDASAQEICLARSSGVKEAYRNQQHAEVDVTRSPTPFSRRGGGMMSYQSSVAASTSVCTPTIIKPPTGKMSWNRGVNSTTGVNQADRTAALHHKDDSVFEDDAGTSDSHKSSNRSSLPPPCIDNLFTNRSQTSQKKDKKSRKLEAKKVWGGTPNGNKSRVFSMDPDFFDEALNMKNQADGLDGTKSTTKSSTITIKKNVPPTKNDVRGGQGERDDSSGFTNSPDDLMIDPHGFKEGRGAEGQIHRDTFSNFICTFFDLADPSTGKSMLPNQGSKPSDNNDPVDLVTADVKEYLRNMSRNAKPISMKMLEQLSNDTKREAQFCEDYSLKHLGAFANEICSTNDAQLPEEVLENLIKIDNAVAVEGSQEHAQRVLLMLNHPTGDKIAGCSTRNVIEFGEELNHVMNSQLNVRDSTVDFAVELHGILRPSGKFGSQQSLDPKRPHQFLNFLSLDDVVHLQTQCLRSKIPYLRSTQADPINQYSANVSTPSEGFYDQQQTRDGLPRTPSNLVTPDQMQNYHLMVAYQQQQYFAAQQSTRSMPGNQAVGGLQSSAQQHGRQQWM
eukprot:GHVH01008460.1.p1 GENE.GHVH01008460.1~~GHVH01008460.1.p1  ORF type:complete len:841 (+),score=109.82 GHVH01008460.1:334-2523(+)